MWGATVLEGIEYATESISIHAPRVGRDGVRLLKEAKRNDFNPRAPCGARLLIVILTCVVVAISIHAPRVGRDDCFQIVFNKWAVISIHAPRVGRDYTILVCLSILF